MDTPEQDVSFLPVINRVALRAPLGWVARGWRDFAHRPGISLFYGVAFALMGGLLVGALAESAAVALALETGFLLVGPFLALGLYEKSRRLEAQEPLTLWDTLTAARRNPSGIGWFALILLLIMAAWGRISVVLIAVSFDGPIPAAPEIFSGRYFNLQTLPFLAIYFGVGAAFAAFVFALSAVAVPMLLSRDGDTVSSMIASAAATLRNGAAMLLWGAIIVALTLAGFATAFVGLVVVMPLIGHASWHCYRDLIGPSAPRSRANTTDATPDGG
jgi:uncharacterized membrane protein